MNGVWFDFDHVDDWAKKKKTNLNNIESNKKKKKRSRLMHKNRQIDKMKWI